MAFRTRCSACGKLQWVAADAVATGTICAACGHAFVPSPGSSLLAEAARVIDSVAAEEAASEDASFPLPEATPIPSSALAQTPFSAQTPSSLPVESIDPSPLPPVESAPASTADSGGLPPLLSPPPLPPPVAATHTPLLNAITAWQTDTPMTPVPPAGAAVSPASPTELPPPSSERNASLSLPARLLMLLAAIVLGGALIWWMLTGGKSWDQRNLPAILGLKQQAEVSIADGRLADAVDEYHTLENLVAGHRITDPYVSSELQQAWARRDECVAILLERQRTAALASATPATAPIAAKPPAIGPAPSIAAAPATLPAAASQPAVAQNVSASPPPAPAPIVETTTAPALPAVATLPHPPTHPDPVAAPQPTDAEIGASIGKAVTYLLDSLSDAGNRNRFANVEGDDGGFQEGLDTLCIYALLQAEQAEFDPRLDITADPMKSLIERMKGFPMDSHYAVYGRGIRATALALLNRPQDHEALTEDVLWLLRAEADGAYTYGARAARLRTDEAPWDNSNSQYGLLGVWSGADVGIPVPSDYWGLVQRHWTRFQLTDGQWSYTQNDGNPRLSMTLAGIASLFVTHDHLDWLESADELNRPPYSPALAKALDWLETDDNCLPTRDEQDPGYTLYGLERVGLASGYKFFGNHDWYRELAIEVMNQQYANGSWGSPLETSYCLLFLARGRHPVVMNKVRFDGAWANRPRDVANLAAFASDQLERPLNWQVTPLWRNWQDWTDSPTLYISSHRPVPIGDADLEKIRNFILAGGMLYTQSDGDSDAFNTFIDGLGKKLFPQYPWQDVPADHPIYSVFSKVDPAPPLREITNGARILVLHSPHDISRWWQARNLAEHRGDFDMGVNIFLYSFGKTDLRNRLSTPLLATPPQMPAARLPLAELRYQGNWDPEPAAWPRFNAYLQQQTALGVTLEPVDIAALTPQTAPIAHLTGTARFNPSLVELHAIENYINSGGVLLIDPAGGPNGFYDSALDWLRAAFPRSALEVVHDRDPLLSGANDPAMENVARVELRPYARDRYTKEQAALTILRAGKGAVIIAPLDITCSLLGTNTWGISGYQPPYTLKLVKNIVLWAWDTSPLAR